MSGNGNPYYYYISMNIQFELELVGWVGQFLPTEWLYSGLDGSESNSYVSLYLQSSSVICLYSCHSRKGFLTKICSRKKEAGLSSLL